MLMFQMRVTCTLNVHYPHDTLYTYIYIVPIGHIQSVNLPNNELFLNCLHVHVHHKFVNNCTCTCTCVCMCVQ